MQSHLRILLPALLTAIIALAAAVPSLAQERNPTIEVRPGGLMAHRVALQRFADAGPGSAAARPDALREALRGGLEFTSSVVTLPDAAFLGPVETDSLQGARRQDCADWRTSGADVLVEGVHMEAAGSWMQHYRDCSRLVLRDLTVFNHVAFNTAL